MRSLKQVRKDNQLTLEMVAENTGISPATLSLIEQGKSIANYNTRKTLEDFFDSPIDWIWGYHVIGMDKDSSLEARMDAERTFRKLLNEVASIPLDIRGEFIDLLIVYLERLKLFRK